MLAMRLRALAVALLLAGCAAAPAPERAPEAGSGFAPRPSLVAQRQIVVAAHPLAAQAGLQMLRAGGTAVDAAIAAQWVLGLVEPQSSGLGGGLFLVHHDGRATTTIDGRETAPADATPALFQREGRALAFGTAVASGRATGVPGTVRALELAHRRFGRLPWRDLFAPAIALAEAGVPVGPRLAALLRDDSARALRDDPAARALFFDAAGEPLRVGTVLRNPAYAQTLRRLAEAGADAFYRGEIARDIVAAVRGHPALPGTLSEDDLAAYRAVERAPVCSDYRAWRLCGMGPPSSGAVAVGQMLGLLAGHDLAALPPAAGPLGMEPAAQAVHLISEAGRLAYADRARYLADPGFVPQPVDGLLDAAYLAGRAQAIGPRSMGRAAPGAPRGAPLASADGHSPERPATTHLVAIDAEGRAVAMTSSIEAAFGSKRMVRGFLLNNQLTDFSFVAEEGGRPVANRVEPGKRPRSSMAPTLVFERAGGRLVLALGSAGGSAIPNHVVKTVVGVFDWRLPLPEALALPYAASRNGPTELEEGRTGPALADALRALGHEVVVGPQTSGLHAVQRVPGGWLGAADPRREGAAAGD